MAGDSYSSAVQKFPITDTENDTPSEQRPMLDVALPAPPAISALQDSLIGDSVTPGGRMFTRVVHASGGQSDVIDPGV